MERTGSIDLFIKIYGQETANLLGLEKIPSDSITLTPALFKKVNRKFREGRTQSKREHKQGAFTTSAKSKNAVCVLSCLPLRDFTRKE